MPPLVELTAPVVLVYGLGTLQHIDDDRAGGVRRNRPARQADAARPGRSVAVPPQLFVSPLGVATTNPAGSVSVKATPVSATVFAAGFVMVNVSVVMPLNTMVVGLNAFAIDGRRHDDNAGGGRPARAALG